MPPEPGVQPHLRGLCGRTRYSAPQAWFGAWTSPRSSASSAPLAYTRSFTSAAAFSITVLLAPGAQPMSPAPLPRLCSSPPRLCSSPPSSHAPRLTYAVTFCSKRKISPLELSHPRLRWPWVSSEAKCIARHSNAWLLGRLGLFLHPKAAAAAPFAPGHKRTAIRKHLLPPREQGLVCLKLALGTKFLAPLALGGWERNRRVQCKHRPVFLHVNVAPISFHHWFVLPFKNIYVFGTYNGLATRNVWRKSRPPRFQSCTLNCSGMTQATNGTNKGAEVIPIRQCMFCIIVASVDGIFFIFPLHFAFPAFFQNNASFICGACPLLNTHSPWNNFTMKQSTRNDKKPFRITLIW